jgi:hypothetical protein
MVGRRWGTVVVATLVAVTAGLAVAVVALPAPAAQQGWCPHRDRDPRSDNDDAKRILVPRGARDAWLCRYRGLNPNPAQVHTLAYSRHVTKGPQVRQLTRRFNALKPWPNNGQGVTTCPFSDSSEVVAFFRYSRSSDVPVSVSLNGCRSVTNGQLTRDGLRDPGPRLLRHLESLTNCKRQKAIAWCGQ